MAGLKYLTALATLAVVFGSGGAAQADPYADSVVDLSRVEEGFSRFNPEMITPDLTTIGDDTLIDNGINALGAPDFMPNAVHTSTTLGFDENGNTDTSDDFGGRIVLSFDDNVCIDNSEDNSVNSVDDPEADFRIWDVSSNESALVEVSNDGGATFMPLGEVSPFNGYTPDVAGAVGFFNQVRIEASDWRTNKSFAGMELDAVSCLHSVEAAAAATNAEGCDMGAGEEGLDVKDVVAYSDGMTVFVNLNICGPVSDSVKYNVHFDYTDKTNLDGDRTDDGPDTFDTNPHCRRTYDDTVSYKNGATSGNGLFTVLDHQLWLEVDYLDFVDGNGVAPGSQLLVWASTKQGRMSDRLPNTEGGDRCSKPQTSGEVLTLTLQDLPLQ